MKTYEQYIKIDTSYLPKVGDYVICIDEDDTGPTTTNLKMVYVRDHIGQIVEIRYLGGEGNYPYSVQYKDDKGENLFRVVFSSDELKEFAPTKEELELKLAAKKYNL